MKCVAYFTGVFVENEGEDLTEAIQPKLVSKAQIAFKDPAEQDYISNLNRLRYASRREFLRKRSIHGSM